MIFYFFEAHMRFVTSAGFGQLCLQILLVDQLALILPTAIMINIALPLYVRRLELKVLLLVFIIRRGVLVLSNRDYAFLFFLRAFLCWHGRALAVDG